MDTKPLKILDALIRYYEKAHLEALNSGNLERATQLYQKLESTSERRDRQQKIMGKGGQDLEPAPGEADSREERLYQIKEPVGEGRRDKSYAVPD